MDPQTTLIFFLFQRLNGSVPNIFVYLFRWFKDGKLLTDQEKYQTYSEPRSGVVVFVIKNPGERDLGRYECEVLYCILL